MRWRCGCPVLSDLACGTRGWQPGERGLYAHGPHPLWSPGLTRITPDPNGTGGKPCIRGLRVTVGTVVGLVAAGRSDDEVLRLYPNLAAADIREALSYAAWRVEELEVPLAVA